MTAIRDLDLYGSEVENSVYACQHKLIGNALGIAGGSSNNSHVDFPLFYDIFKFADMIYHKPIGEPFPHLLGIDIESRREDVPVLYEIPVTHQCRSKIAKSHHCEVPGAV